MAFPPFRDRTRRRILQHHLPLLALSSLAIAALYFTRPYPDVITRLSFSTAYPALFLLAVTLLLGPWNLLRRTPNPLSSDLRRDLGIWAGILAIAHTAIGQCVHLRGRPWLYYIYSPQEHHHGLRHDLFGFSNYTGVIAVLLVLCLLATSNDYSLRRLGKARWKRIQQWNYFLIALTAAHAIGYLFIEKQKFAFDTTIAACLLAVVVFQALGYMKRRRFAALPRGSSA